MRVRSLLEALRNNGVENVEYRGDLDVAFDGFSVRVLPEAVKGRCFFLVDGGWPARWRKDTAWSQEGASARISRANAGGATCLVVSEKVCTAEVRRELQGHNVFIVPNSYQFYFDAGKVLRESNRACGFTSVTGSVGKTSTIAMIGHALASLDKSVFMTPKSQNVAVAVVRNVSQTEGYEHAVIEMSHGACKTFAARRYSMQADVAVVTAIAAAHLGDIGTLEDVAKVKSAVFDDPPPGGAAVICLDTPHSDILVARAHRAGRQVVTYGESAQAGIRLVDYDPVSRRVTAEIGRERVNYQLGVEGKHNAMNSLAVIGVLRAYRIQEWKQGIASLSSFAPVEGRGDRIELKLSSGIRVSVINETYNANPTSIGASIETLAARHLAVGKRKVALLGDVLELGEHSEEAHRSMADPLEAAHLDEVILFGAEMDALRDELERRAIGCRYFSTLEELTYSLPELLQEGDEVLAKASNGTGLNAWLKKAAD